MPLRTYIRSYGQFPPYMPRGLSLWFQMSKLKFFGEESPKMGSKQYSTPDSDINLFGLHFLLQN